MISTRQVRKIDDSIRKRIDLFKLLVDVKELTLLEEYVLANPQYTENQKSKSVARINALRTVLEI